MTCPANLPSFLFASQNFQGVDPGDAKTISIGKMFEIIPLVSAAAETRTLAAPVRLGIMAILEHKTDGGDITVTVTGGYNEDGSTSIVFSDPGQFAVFLSVDIGGTMTWRKIADHAAGNLTVTEAGYLNGITPGTQAASKAVVADANVNTGVHKVTELHIGTSGSETQVTSTAAELNYLDQNLATNVLTRGAGVDTAESYVGSISRMGGLIVTSIVVDITTLIGSATDTDIIGESAAASCHWGQITTAKSGTLIGGKVTCLEVPAGGTADINFYSANESTGAQDALATSLTETVLIDAAGAWTSGAAKGMTALPPANDYLYIANGAASGGTFTAGKFLIELYGV